MKLLPQLPLPPETYDQSYQNALIRVISQALTALQTNGSLNLFGVPATGYNLAIGDVYQDAGTLKVVLPNRAYAPSLAAMSKLGSVTVWIH